MDSRSGRRRRRRARTLVAVVAALTLCAACTEHPRAAPRTEPTRTEPTRTEPGRQPPTPEDGASFRAFTPGSWWNTPVPDDAPSNPDAARILDYMRTAREAGDGCVRLTGLDRNSWGQPVYWARPGDPEYDVATDVGPRPPELDSLRIPRGARAADNSDGSMTVFDVDRGYVVAFTDAVHDAAADRWSAGGATVTYLDSNGLDTRTGAASDDRNLGSHRGNNGAVMMARLDEVSAGRIEHVLKVASGPEVSRRAVFPMVASDGHSRKPDAPPQGLRFRIKPSVDLDELGLASQALVIARALQEYGFYIGDSSGVTALKLEDTRLEHHGQEWSLSSDALCDLPLSPEFWDVLPAGYAPPGSS